MKFVFATVALLFAFQASAETSLTCWNMFSKSGSKPILKAKIKRSTTLADVTFDLKAETFSLYFQDKDEAAGDNWPGKRKTTKSELVNPVDDLKPEESTHAPYKGDNQYSFNFGSYAFVAPFITQKGKYDARLILPPDLSNENLKTFRIRTASERSNAVLIYPPQYGSDQGGQNYLRMFCSSK